MKKIIAALMAVAILLSLCACGSTSTPKKKDIDDITAEDMQAAADKLTGVEEVNAPAQAADEVPPLEDYLVTVEMTPENFGDYFEFVMMPVLDSWGEATGEYRFGLKSKVYEQGLYFIDTHSSSWCEYGKDFQFEVEITNWWSEPDTRTFEKAGISSLLHFFWTSTEKENIEFVIQRVKGTAAFVKSEYIDHEEVVYTKKEYGQDCSGINIYLKDGHRLENRYFTGIDARY